MAVAVVIGLVAAAIADGIAGLGNYAAIAGIVALFSLAVAAPTALLARIWPPLVALAVLAFIVFGIPASGGPANLASFTPGFLRVLGPGPAARGRGQRRPQRRLLRRPRHRRRTSGPWPPGRWRASSA